MAAVPLQLRREETLRTRASRGDENAFAVVYERHHQALYRYCRSILHHDHDAQDALQSTMARAFAALQDERRDIDLRPWLFRIAHNEAITIVRRRKASAELTDIPDADDLDDRISDREELRNLRLDLADLPERQRAALVLRELNGLSHAEIGAVLELSPSAVKQSIFEARTALFSCREGRDIACSDIQRMLSDGDGRVLRGRGVRAHLRSCPECRAFRAELGQRPKALQALAPPLPVGGAAAMLAQLLVGGGTAAKMLACVALVGGGTTLAAEMHIARQPGKPAEAAAATNPKRTPTLTPRPTVTPVKSVPTVVVAPALASAKRPSRVADRRAKPVEKAAKPNRKAAKPALPAHAEKPAKPDKGAKPFKAQQPVKANLGKSIAKVQKQVAKAEARKVAKVQKQEAKVQKQVAKAEKQVAQAEAKQVAKAEPKQVGKPEAKQGGEDKPDKKPR